MESHRANRAVAERIDGYAALRSYAAIGDGRTVALISDDGCVDWYPLPDLDSKPVFARLLDAETGGTFQLCPTDEFRVEREYLSGTNILCSTYSTDSGQVRVIDALNTGAGGDRPWGELCRRVEGVAGAVEMGWHITPGNLLKSASPWIDDTEHGPVIRIGQVMLGVRVLRAGKLDTSTGAISGAFTTEPESTHLVAMVSTEGEPLPLPDPQRMLAGMHDTASRWRTWIGQLRYDGPWSEAVLRSALTLRLLTNAQTGAIAAAATTSLPESWDGDKNWDYRYAWIRDAAYTLHTLIRCGESEEVHGAVSWLLRTIRSQGPDPEAFTRLDGGEPEEEMRQDAPGWRGIGPVVVGNRAVGQLQLGVFGDLFDMVALYVQGGNILDAGTARLLADIADHTCDVWQRRDAGIWELLTERHYTSSKMGCVHALDCAVQLAEAGHILGATDRWRNESSRIRRWIADNCWCEAKQSYVWYPGTEDLDASVLLHAIGGFDRGHRMSSTIDAVRSELGAGPLVYRYSGAAANEGCFVACAFWMAGALAEVGRRDEAIDLMDQLVPLANDVGLLTEMIDPGDMSFLGNFPQGLSHLALMTAALSIIQQY